MKFEIKNRFTGAVQFTAEIACAEDAPISVKIALSVKWAVKAGADLAGANLAGANLARANLARANLAGANLAGAIDIKPEVGSWHGPKNEWCGTTHCRAGWAVHLGGEKGRELENRVGSQMAGAMIYRASRPGPAPWFFASTEAALEDIRKCAAEQTAAK